MDDFKVNEEEGISHGHISAEIQRHWGQFYQKFSKIFKIMKPIKSRTGYEKALGTVEAIGKFETKLNQIILGYSR